MGFILVIHVIVCVLLVIVILMQAGRGGGLTETFQSAESMFGTQTNAFMVRLTTILAIIFLCTSLLFAFKSSKGGQSLMANKKLLSTVAKPVAAPETAIPVTNAAK
jgi:preprotein translocase subunit SecG